VLIAMLQTCTMAAVMLGGGQTVGSGAGQVSDSARTTQWSNGEVNSLELDMIRNQLFGIGPSGVRVPPIEGSVIIIAHIGVGERSRVRDWRRLYNVREYLVEHGVSPERIVTAEGVASRGKATVEIFLGGRLRLTITVARNKDINVDCCEGFPQYYPWRRGRPILQ
jgi:hypothetical protein